MAAIPRVDHNIVFKDTGYQFQFTEADTSTTLGAFGIGTASFNSISVLKGSGGAVAQFPTYNSLNHFPLTPPYRNEALGPASATSFAFDNTGPSPANAQIVFDGARWWVLDVGNINPGGVLQVKFLPWPGIVNENATGLVTLNITNPQAHAVFTIFGCNFTDGSPGLIVSALNLITGFDDVLAITLAMAQGSGAPTTWINDQTDGTIGTQAFSWPLPGSAQNFQADQSNAPTMQMWLQQYDMSGPSLVQTVTLFGSGDLPANPLNSFKPPNFPNQPFFYFAAFGTTPAGPSGIFGIDFDEFGGANSGCWYCAFDCSAYGQITFTMPDASLGPSSDPTVYWVFRANNGGFGPTAGFNVYPNTDAAGDVWWIRVPLVNPGTGDMIIETLTGEVYTTVAPAAATGRILGSFVGFISAGQFSGGSK